MSWEWKGQKFQLSHVKLLDGKTAKSQIDKFTYLGSVPIGDVHMLWYFTYLTDARSECTMESSLVLPRHIDS